MWLKSSKFSINIKLLSLSSIVVSHSSSFYLLSIFRQYLHLIYRRKSLYITTISEHNIHKNINEDALAYFYMKRYNLVTNQQCMYYVHIVEFKSNSLDICIDLPFFLFFISFCVGRIHLVTWLGSYCTTML